MFYNVLIHTITMGLERENTSDHEAGTIGLVIKKLL